MSLTVFLSVLMMAGLFLMLLAGVGFIQDRRFFTSAPKEVRAVVRDKEERFPGQHVLGWILAIISVIIMIEALVYGAWDGIRNDFTFWQFFGRFITMLLLLKAYDILFFDWFLLCRSNFFPHYYPEVKNVLGPYLFGYNKRSHVMQIILFFVVSSVLAGICSLL